MADEAEGAEGREEHRLIEFQFRVRRFDGKNDGRLVIPYRTVLLMTILSFPPFTMALWLVRDIGLMVTEDGRFKTVDGKDQVLGDVFHRLPADLENQYLLMEELKKARN